MCFEPDGEEYAIGELKEGLGASLSHAWAVLHMEGGAGIFLCFEASSWARPRSTDLQFARQVKCLQAVTCDMEHVGETEVTLHAELSCPRRVLSTAGSDQ
jgi:hypothetical protein